VLHWIYANTLKENIMKKIYLTHKKIKRALIISLIIVLGLNTACTDELLQEDPVDRFVVGNFYSSESDAKAAVDAIYNRIGANYYERRFSLLADLATDDMKDGIGMANSDLQDIEYCRQTTQNKFVTNLWAATYDGIARANIAISAIPDITMDETVKNRLIGEAMFLRALFYFNTVRFWGEVPLITKLESLEDAYTPNASINEIYGQIIGDLGFASNHLPANLSPNEAGRASMGAAKILLGKVYLTTGEWQSAADILNEVISNESGHGFGLHDNFRANWEVPTEHGPEMVFAVQFLATPGNGNQMNQAVGPKYSINGGKAFGYSRVWESDIPTLDLFSAFDDADERKIGGTFIIDYVSPNDGEIYSSSIPNFYKYFEVGLTDTRQGNNDFHVLRYSDAILMYAEALNELSRTGEAESFINRIRERAFNDTNHNYTGLSQTAMRDAIKLERRFEFAHEGQRFFDLVRWGDFVSTMKTHGATEAQLTGVTIKNDITNNVSETNNLFPIPQHDIDLNPDNLVQNPGY
jgi:hypothetical protein